MDASASQPDPPTAWRGVIEAPETIILDCGSWTFNGTKRDQYFGAVSQSWACIGSFAPGKTFSTQQMFTEAPLLGGLFSKAVLGQKPRVVACRRARAWLAKDAPRKHELLTKRGELLVFIPDCHLGLMDKADDFCRRAQPPDLGQLERLAAFLASVKPAVSKTRTRVIQTGDFFDIWEAEADEGVYTKERTRAARLARAAERLAATWRSGTHAEKFTELMSKIDVFLHGNHDWEAKFDASVKGRLYGSGSTRERWTSRVGGESTSTHTVVAEHGHQYDKYNMTAGASDVDAMMAVKGKPITFAWARAERDQRYDRWDTADEHGMKTRWALRQAQSSPSKIWGWALVGTPQVARSGKAVAEDHAFDTMRRHLQYFLRDKAAIPLVAGASDTNPSEELLRKIRENEVGPHDHNVEIAATRWSGIYRSSRVDPAVEVYARLFVHSHTHDPQLTAYLYW